MDEGFTVYDLQILAESQNYTNKMLNTLTDIFDKYQWTENKNNIDK